MMNNIDIEKARELERDLDLRKQALGFRVWDWCVAMDMPHSNAAWQAVRVAMGECKKVQAQIDALRADLFCPGPCRHEGHTKDNCDAVRLEDL